MRLFVGLDLPSAVLRATHASIAALRPITPHVRWSPTDNLHITIKFIGEWPSDRLDLLKDALSTVPRPGPIPIHITGFGWFPGRAFWAGVKAGDALRTFAHETNVAMSKLGVAPETRQYNPHVTLATFNARTNVAALHRAVEHSPPQDLGRFSAESFYIFSVSSGPRYTKIAEFPL